MTSSVSPQCPMFESMKRDWAEGVFTTKHVQEYCMGASCHGARSIEKMTTIMGQSDKNPQNLLRAMKRACFGHPREHLR